MFYLLLYAVELLCYLKILNLIQLMNNCIGKLHFQRLKSSRMKILYQKHNQNYLQEYFRPYF